MKAAVQAEIDLGDACHRRKLALILNAVAAERPDIVERSRLEADEIVAANQVVVAPTGCFLGRHDRLVETWRQHVD